MQRRQPYGNAQRSGSTYVQRFRVRADLLHWGSYRAQPLETLEDEIIRFHSLIEDLAKHLDSETPLLGVTEEQLLQGPFSNAMTHAGQLAMLRRRAGVPVAPDAIWYERPVADVRANSISSKLPS